MFSSDADLFFEDPTTDKQKPNYFGVLYLLRRDINQCMENKIIWPGVMTIFAGIDLLGKFYAGNDDQGNVGDRFENFVAQYFNTNHKNKTVIYQLRNSLLHSFCLYSKKYKFVLSQNLREFILHTSGTYIIDIRELHEQFESAVNTYCIDVNKNKNLQENFTKMFKDYGKIRIG